MKYIIITIVISLISLTWGLYDIYIRDHKNEDEDKAYVDWTFSMGSIGVGIMGLIASVLYVIFKM